MSRYPWYKALTGVRLVFGGLLARVKRLLQSTTAPVHPYMGEMVAYVKFLHSEGQDNMLLRHIGPPQKVENFMELLVAEDGKERVDTIIVSDLHLGSRLSLAHALEKALVRFSFKRIILNGDILDQLNTSLSPAHHVLLTRLRALSRTHEVVWIEGNHDEGLDRLLGSIGVAVRKEYEWGYRGKRYLALHGDQFDSFYMMVQWVGGPMSRPFCSWLKRTTKLYTNAITSSVRGALKHAREREVDYVFCGHTHHVHYEKTDGVDYYNPGGWTESPCHLIAVSEGGIRIHAFDKTGEHLGLLSPLTKPDLAATREPRF